MRIAILCPSFIEGKSYQENIWAEQLAKAGHTVRAYTAGAETGAVRVVESSIGRYELHVVRTRRLPRGTYWSGAVRSAVEDFNPNLIVICGDKTWTLPVLRSQRLAGAAVVSTFSENRSMHEFDWRKRGISLQQRLWALGFVLTRGRTIRAVCRRSTLVVGNTPQAREILSRVFTAREWAQIDAKMIDRPLGFSPEHFFYDPTVRRRVRADLGIHESDIVICASSHFAPVKEPGIRLFIDAVRSVMNSQPQVKALIIGFSDAAECAGVTERISRHILAGAFAERFITHPFAGRDRLCELFNASDIAYFARASISCQEALGTGLVGCFVDDGSLNHLVTLPNQGYFFPAGDERQITQQLRAAAVHLGAMRGDQCDGFRCNLATGSTWLAFDRIILSIVEAVRKQQSASENPRFSTAERQ